MPDLLMILFFGPSVMLTTDSKKWQIFRPICVLMKFDHMRPALYEWWQTFFRLGQTQGMATPPKHNFSPQKGWLPPKEGTPHPQRFFKRVLKLYSQIKSVYNRIYNSWSNAQFKQIHVACPRVFPGLGVAGPLLLVMPGSTYRNSCSFVLCEPDGRGRSSHWGADP